MTDYSELKKAALSATPGVWVARADGWTIRAYPDARMACDGIKVVHTCSAHMQGQGTQPDIEQQVANQHYIEQAQPTVVLALISEIEEFRAVAAQPEALNASPADEYEGLRRQFFALRNYAICKDKLAGYYSRELEGLRRVDRSLSAGEIDAERSINEQLTNDLLGAEAEIEALRKDAERYRWLKEKGLHHSIDAATPAIAPGVGPFICVQLPSSGAPNSVRLGAGADEYVDLAMGKEG